MRPDGKCLSCSEASIRAVSLSPCSYRYNYKALSHVQIITLKFSFKGMAFECKAGSNGYTRNPDFSSQNKRGFTQSKNKKTEDRDNSDNPEELELFPSKNRPFQENETPPEQSAKEEITNFLRPFKAQLKQRSDVKKGKNPEEVQGRGEEKSGSGLSLSKVVRKYVTQRGTPCSGNGSSRDDFLDQSEQDGRFDEEKNKSSPNLGSKIPMGKHCRGNGISRDYLLDMYEQLDGSFAEEKSSRSHKLARNRITAMGKKSSTSSFTSGGGGGGSRTIDFLDQSEQDGLFDEEKSSSTVRLPSKRNTQIGERSTSNGSSSSRDFFLDESVQDGLFDEEKSTSSFDSNEIVEQKSPFLEHLSQHTNKTGNKSRSSGSSSRGLDQSEQNGAFSEEKATASFDSNDSEKRESPPVSRPLSKFRRRSPIPIVKFELVRPNSVADSNLDGKRESTLLEHEKREDSSDLDECYIHDQVEKQKPTIDGDDLSAMKVPELRALAKSRGMKGFSRLKKLQLLELLSCGST